MAPESRRLNVTVRAQRRRHHAFLTPLGAAAVALALLTGAAAATPDSPSAALVGDPVVEGAGELLVNERAPIDGVLTGGAPRSQEGFQALAAAGFRTFVDLRDDPETIAAARADAEAAGLTYESIAIGGEAELDLRSARALASILEEITRYPIAIACSSGNRAGALLAVESFWLDGSSAESALDLGERAGLTRLAPSVRILLGLPPATPPAESIAP